ncbi:hypothetical protein JZ751_023582 [Albula glossodonta]|uniref:DNA repair protein REV1 n=1 Tax=Albula glossodonta TaxID=121402 RepID=A0A8T2NGD7_9TELE|nr:hypothetical protein JZ751_023582 [Albula glossodonta]
MVPCSGFVRNKVLMLQAGFMAAKVRKLEEQFRLDAPREKQKEGSFSDIFNGVSICVNGYTDPTSDELRRLMMLHGGQFHMYFSRSKTTHVIATHLPQSKIKELRDEKVVRPEWITDSIKAGRLLSCLQYQLYRPTGLCFPSACAPQGQEPAGPSHLQNHTHHALWELSHAHRKLELDLRLNGSVRNCVDRTARPKMNGVLSEGGGETVDKPLTNGHTHHVNGALKPLDLVLHSGREPVGKQQRQSPSDRPATPSRAERPTGQTRPRQTLSAQSSAAPNTASQHRPTPQPSANQKPATVTMPQMQQTPPPPSPNHEKPLRDSCDSTPHRGRVKLNGAHSATPPGPAPPHPVSALHPPDSPGKRFTPPTDVDFISQYYSLSRFHHISTWRNEFSQYINSLQQQRRQKGGAVFPGRERLRRQRAAYGTGSAGQTGPQNRQACILHVDMDCFFVSVGIRNRPDLKGKAVAVTSNRGPGTVAPRPGFNPQMELRYYQRKVAQSRAGRREGDLDANSSPESPDDPSNGLDPALVALSMAEIASCSYEARQAGVRNGMFFGQAKRLCPGLQAVPYDFQAYKEVALAMYETLASYTHDIEALSCDEALMDASGMLAELGVSPDELASAIRADVKERTGCSASIGMASNILLARMATRKAKPNGQYYLKPEEVDDFIRDQPVTSLPGVGRSMGSKLASLGVRTCGDMQQVAMSRLQKEFGLRTGQTLFRFCRGLDDRPVRSEKERKSVSADMNYGIRFSQVSEAETFLIGLSQEVQRRLQAVGLQGRRITLRVMVRKPGAPVEPAKYGGHGICDSLARSVTMDRPSDTSEVIGAEVLKLFHSMNLNVADVRGVGMQVHQLVGSRPAPQDMPRPRSIRDLLLAQRPTQSYAGTPPTTPEAMTPTAPLPSTGSSIHSGCSPATAPPFTSSSSTPSSSSLPSASTSTAEPMPSTSKGEPPPRYNGGLHTPNHAKTRLNCSIEVPSPSQVDRSVLEALPAEIREQVEQSWSHKGDPPNGLTLSPAQAPPLCMLNPAQAPPPGTLILQIPGQPGQAGGAGVVLALPDLSQVDPEVFAALPSELQEELRTAYGRRVNAHSQNSVPKNALLQLRQPEISPTKRRCKRKNLSPTKKCSSPMKSRLPGNSPAKSSPAKLHPVALNHVDMPTDAQKQEVGPCTSSLKPDVPQHPSKVMPNPHPTLAGACELTDIRTLLREWVTSISEPMEEDILQVVKYCTDLVEDRDLEKLDLVIKYMKRLMQQSVESVWSMAFDFILDNVQVVVQQIYGSTLKIT